MTSTAPATPGRVLPAPASVPLAVVAAHRRGLPLHPQLVALGATFRAVATTAPVYRLLALAGGGAARGGLLRTGAGGAGIEVELHDLPLARLGELVVLLPSPLAVGTVELADGTAAVGLVCTHAPPDAVDVSEHVSWPRYLSSLPAAPPPRPA
jgi:allophanate hydrolase